MKTNTAKAMWREGKLTHGAWLSIPSPVSAEAMAHQGFDWLCIDMQHWLIDYQVALSMLQAINTTETIPFVRVPWNEPGIIGKMLDAGALGVIIPMVNSVEEARAAVAACRHPTARAARPPGWATPRRRLLRRRERRSGVHPHDRNRPGARAA
jgi:4-hydroxy-2-oxoheptanedioate aldolase